MVEMAELDRAGVLTAVASTLAQQLELDARQLALAANWADLHHPDSIPRADTERELARRRFDGLTAVRPGGEGTPEVLAGCPAELGLVLRTSAVGAKHLIADALDLRHRLPSLWAELHAGRVRAWKARRVAQATRHLPLACMGEVDRGLAGLLPALPWARFETVLDATVMRADPAGAQVAEAEAASRRFVCLAHAGPSDAHGLKTLIARGETLNILTFLAAVNRIADLLALEGDDATVEVRRSKAVGVLGQPDRALALLSAHRHDPDQPREPVLTRQNSWPRPHPAGTAPSWGEPQESSPGPVASDYSDVGPRVDPTCDVPPADDAGRPEQDDDTARSLDLGESPAARGTSAGVHAQLYVHLTESALICADPTAVARVEGVGPVTAATIRRWLGRDDLRITVRPVTVPGHAVPVDGYEIPQRVREAVRLRNPASAYPWSTCTDRQALQLDHVQPWRAAGGDGPPGPVGQTGPANLAPLAQPEHQRKTSRRWQERSPAPGVYLWRSPHGWVTLVTNQGTFPLGRDEQARAIWRATAPALAMAA